MRRLAELAARSVRVGAIALAALAAAACETPAPRPAPSAPAPAPTQPAPRPPAPRPAPPAPPAAPAPPVKSPADLALEEGTALYDSGDYNGAIRSLTGAREIWDGPVAVRVAAHKYIAFSYCVTNRRAQCRAQFVEALKLDPGFSLEPAERSHPIWGPEYEAARKIVPIAPTPPPRPAPPKPPAK